MRATYLTQALCELVDVSDKEKHFFLLWNNFVRQTPVLLHDELAARSKEFVKEHADMIQSKHLEDQLLAHLLNMWYEGALKRHDMLEAMDLYHDEAEKLKGAQP